MVDASKYRDDENTRPCPTCRMPVSVLAIKCRFCGAEMGRPKEAARSLSVEDLGGETIIHYAPSSNVMDAIEAFRNEETSPGRKTPRLKDKGSIFGRIARKSGKGGADSDAKADGLPELDERSRALASIAMPRHSTTVLKRKTTKFNPTDYARYAIIGLVILACSFVAVSYGPGWWKALTAPAAINFISRVPELLRNGAAPVEVLAAAVEAQRADPTAEHTSDLNTAREAVIAEVNGLLNANDWNRNMLSQAARIATKAASIDTAPTIQQLKLKAEAESRTYNAILESLNFDEGTATFHVYEPDDARATVKQGDLLAERFRVTSIRRDVVRLLDTQRNDREVTTRPGKRLIE